MSTSTATMTIKTAILQPLELASHIDAEDAKDDDDHKDHHHISHDTDTDFQVGTYMYRSSSAANYSQRSAISSETI